MLYVPTPEENATAESVPVRRVTGRFLAHNRLDARGRAELARDVVAGKAEIDTSTLTVAQITKLCRTNKIYLDAIRFPDRVKHRQQKKLAAIFDAIGPDARAEACRTIGVERVWKALTAAL